MQPPIDQTEATPIAACNALLGEGPVWVASESSLYWVDIEAPMIWRMRWPEGACESWQPPHRISALAPKESGGFIAATERGFAELDFDQQYFRLLHEPEPHLPGNRFNDGKTDRQGNFWAGSMDDAETEECGSLYRFDRNLKCWLFDEGYRVPNGPAFSRDGQLLYHTDSAKRRIYRFVLEEGILPGKRQEFLAFSEEDGSPDGMTVDAEDCLWVAFWDGWCVRRFAPDGTPLARIALPVQRPTSCAFGGPELDHLFITSARIGLSDEGLATQPHAGDLFVVRPGCEGLPDHLFAG